RPRLRRRAAGARHAAGGGRGHGAQRDVPRGGAAMIAAAALVLAATFTNTADVESIAAAGTTLWAATCGGGERDDLATGKRGRAWFICPALRSWSNDRSAR